MRDAALSAFAVFFMQNPSFLAQQKSLEKAKGKSNLHSLFGVHRTPCDNQIRHLLEIPPTELYPIFHNIYNGLNAIDYFKSFHAINGSLLIALDGIEYFSSTKIHCEHCLTQTIQGDKVRYSHKAITPVIISPTKEEVIPLAPEFIMPQDGHDKQDSELAASTRWLKREKSLFAGQKITILGDDLYAHQPFCETVINNGMHFIFVCKPSSHKTVYEWLDGFEKIGEIRTQSRTQWNGRTHITTEYRYMSQLPLRDTASAMKVNWCDIRITNADGKQLYYNSFITDYDINESNVADIVQAGRRRWKIENENNNTLKTKGYHFEHNFGHGKGYLSAFLATLILLAFLFHIVLEQFDIYYRLLRETTSVHAEDVF